MDTTIRLNENVRDRLQAFKNERGMTYNGAILRLLERASDDQIKEEQAHRAKTRDTGNAYSSISNLDRWYREGADGAVEFLMAILASQLSQPNQYRGLVEATVQDVYGKLEVEPEIEARGTDFTPPELDDVNELLIDRTENPAKYTKTDTELEQEHLSRESVDVLRSLSTYQKSVSDSKILLESDEEPDLDVPPDFVYQGELRDGTTVVTVGSEILDARPDLTGAKSFSWGHRGTGPRVLATAILAHAYPDRYALARTDEFYEEYTSQLSVGEPWEIRAEELSQYTLQ